MMQRATGVMQASRALQPLDSTLAIRVLDQRGEEMRGIAVRWTVSSAGDGAALRVLNATTDSLGLSRAQFAPGKSADAQVVAAEVAGVGRIEFTVSVPVATIRIVPDRLTLWSGDDAIVGVELTDAAGQQLPGGTLFWGSGDTAVLRVRPDDASHARVTGALAGNAALVAWIGDGTLRDTARLSVRAVFTGRFVTLGGEAPPPLRLEIRGDRLRDSIPVSNGQFSKRVDLPAESEVEVRASALADASRYHQVRLRIVSHRELQPMIVALVPTTWRIDAGTYQGRVIEIDAERALVRGARGSAFWRLVPISGPGPRKILGWRQAHLPLRIAFDRARSSEPITAEDSVRFWTIAQQMERDLGASLFTPTEMRSDSDRVNFVPVEIVAQASEGHTSVTWSQPGDAGDGVMLFRRAATLHDTHVVTHELLHLLGFGHTSAWKTVLQPAGGFEPRLTPEDVAYAQLAMRLRRLQETTGARPGLPVASQ